MPISKYDSDTYFPALIPAIGACLEEGAGASQLLTCAHFEYSVSGAMSAIGPGDGGSFNVSLPKEAHVA